MRFEALSPYFIVKVAKDEQAETRQKDGAFYTHSDHVFMQREKQYGEIVSIGDYAKELFPDAKEGHTLIFHHFLTGRDTEDDFCNKNLVGDDEVYNYYAVTVKSLKGERNLTYGVWDGEKIIPHKDIIFLEVAEPVVETKNEPSGLIEIVNFRESRDEIGYKMKNIKDEINELTKTKVSTALTNAITEKEKEMKELSGKVNRKEYAMFPIAYISEKIKSTFKKEYTHVGVLNIAANTRITFMGKEFIVADKKYLALAG